MKLYEKKYLKNKDISSLGAFLVNTSIKFKLYIPRGCGATSVHLHLFGEGIENKTYRTFDFKWEELNGKYDIYSREMNMSDIGVGLYYYKYEIKSDKSIFYGSGDMGTELKELCESSNDGLIQLLIHLDTENKPEWIYGGIMYHIFIDRFRKSGKCKPKKTAIMNNDWYNGIPQFADEPGGYVENNMFFGGDLYGVIEKLDYIKSLGVNCLYLSPVFEAYSNHKYDTSDYMSIDSMFGSEKAFDELIKEAKKRDMHIILDGVFNHTGSDSIYFNKKGTYNSVGAYQSKESPYYEWYNFRNYPDDYECWWNVKILPRVKSDTESYRKFILGDGGVVEKWMKKGIDGFRLDVADELSDEFLKILNKKLKGINPHGIIYGEVWEDASNKIAYGTRKSYFLGNELDSVMNYPFREALIEYIKYGNAKLFAQTCHTLTSHYPKANADVLMNVLGTHDTERILTVLGGENGDGYSNEELSTKRMTTAQRKKAISMLKLAYTIICTVPGIPCIYYGDEAGMEGYRDPFNRLPFPWGKEDIELFEHYKKIGKIRSNEKLYKDGFFDLLECTSELLAFARYNDNEFVLTIVNRGTQKVHIDSNINLKNVETNRAVHTISPNSAVILKGKESYDKLNIEFI
ncbi:MAG: glycoside hydrolase family 13 protein [Clostridia bacterium]|nr:glycoside hydrolase family 13 protein [Clostridia bacterium]